MTTFESFPYVRPEMAKVSKNFEKHLFRFQNAQTAAEQSRSLSRLNAVREADVAPAADAKKK